MAQSICPRYAALKETWSHAWTPYCRLASAGPLVIAVYMAEVRALSALDGSLVWSWQAPSVISEFVVAANTVVLIANRSMHWLSLMTGVVLEAPSITPGGGEYANRYNPLPWGDRLVWTSASSTTTSLWNTSFETPHEATSRPLPCVSVSAVFAATNDRIVLTHARDGYACVSAANIETGELLWEFGGRSDDGFQPNVLAVFESVVIVRQGKELVALSLDSGAELWRREGVGRDLFVRAPGRLLAVSRTRKGAPTRVVTLDVENGAEIANAAYAVMAEGKLSPSAYGLFHDGILWLLDHKENLIGIASNGTEAIELSGMKSSEMAHPPLGAEGCVVIACEHRGLIAYPTRLPTR